MGCAVDDVAADGSAAADDVGTKLTQSFCWTPSARQEW